MSNVSSLELSKKLYELSVWGGNDEDGGCLWVLNADNDLDRFVCTVHEYNSYSDAKKLNSVIYPAYDCGYLLRKIAPAIGDRKMFRRWLDIFLVETDGDYEDALCKLAIKLHEEGILQDE